MARPLPRTSGQNRDATPPTARGGAGGTNEEVHKMAEQRRDADREVRPAVDAGEKVQAKDIRDPGAPARPHAKDKDDEAGIGAVGGLVAGAAAGMAVGGPVGAVVGAGLGVAAGAQAGQAIADNRQDDVPPDQQADAEATGAPRRS